MIATPLKTRFRTGLLLVAGSLALSACATKAPKQLPPDPGAGVATSTNTNDGTLQAPVPGSQADFVAQLMGQDAIYFDTDRYNVDSQDAAALAAQAAWLGKYPGKRATIEGHCDERGTREYNLALGARRAESIRNYLIQRGVSAGRIDTISFGKERPIAPGSSEDSWARNRNGHTAIVSGAQ